ncbi:septum site-determining protein MinC [Aquifex sp.]
MIEIKGKRTPVVYLKILNKENISALKEAIKKRLSNKIFQGSLVIIENPEVLTEEERREIEELIRSLSLGIPSRIEEHKEREVSRLLVVEKSLRAGQRVEHNGDILVLGDVNRDAEVLAGGNIIVMGKLRGVAKAGLIGDEGAVIVALRMEPQLLQIGRIKAILNDEERESPGYPELAKIEGSEIVLEGIEGAERWLRFM